MPLVSKDFPDLNIRLRFNTGHTGVAGGTGCHTGSMSGIYITLEHTCPFQYIDVDHKVIKKFPYRLSMGDYGIMKANTELVEALKVKLKDKPITWADFPDAYASIASSCESIPIWFISDVINYDAPARGGTIGGFHDAYGIRAQIPELMIHGRTHHFAQYLVENKIGYVYSSPMVQNPSHRMSTNYSLNQAWMWIPPTHLQRCVDVSEETGKDKFPLKNDWFKTIGKDLGYEYDSTEFMEEVISKRVFDSGKFPSRRSDEQRFKSRVA
jgi:hypothetical protein